MKNKITLPPIGLRIIKSSVAVFLCYIINLIRGNYGLVFYSQLAALWCMQDYSSQTKAMAIQRTIGTGVGAFFGLIMIVIDVNIPHNNIYDYGIRAVGISLFIILIIYTTVVLDKRNASYFSCVVFLSIVVNHIGDVNPYFFVLNRVLDTMIGIGIGVFVNCFKLPRQKNRDILFLSGMDETLLNEDNNMSGYSRVELNRMLDEGLQFTIVTMRTPASLLESLGDIRLNLPVVVMDGAALYNISEKRFDKVYIISKEESRKVELFFKNNNISFFSNVIIDDTVLIFYSDSDNSVYNDIITKLRKSPYRNYINRPLTSENVVYFMSIEKTEVTEWIVKKLIETGFDRTLKIISYPSTVYEGYSYLKIYNHNATKENMIDYLKEMAAVSRVETFGTIKGRYTHYINPGDTNRVVKIIKKEFGG